MESAEVTEVRFERGLRHFEIIACRAMVAPIAEAAFAPRVYIDLIEAGQPAGDALYEARVDAFLRPACEHAAAQGVIAQRSGIADQKTSLRRTAREIDGSVQGVAAKSLLHRPEGLASQLQHTFAKQGNAHLSPSRS